MHAAPGFATVLTSPAHLYTAVVFGGQKRSNSLSGIFVPEVLMLVYWQWQLWCTTLELSRMYLFFFFTLKAKFVTLSKFYQHRTNRKKKYAWSINLLCCSWILIIIYILYNIYPSLGCKLSLLLSVFSFIALSTNSSRDRPRRLPLWLISTAAFLHVVPPGACYSLCGICLQYTLLTLNLTHWNFSAHVLT